MSGLSLRRLAVAVAAAALIAGAAAGCGPPPREWRVNRISVPPPFPPEAYTHYILGRQAAYEGRHDEAVRELRIAAALAPDEPSLRVAIAEELLADGRVEEARAEAAAILKRWPDLADGWVVRGRVAARGGDVPAAVLAYERAIALHPVDDTAYLLAAGAHQKLGHADAALATYRLLLRRWPDSVEGNYRLGRALLGRKAWDEAERHLLRCVGLDPDHIDARVALAEVYRQTGRAALATQTLRDAFDRSGEDPWVGEQLFRVLLQSGDRAAAVELLGSLDADWRDPESRVLFGQLYLQLRMSAEAIRIADAVLARYPTFHGARLLKARALAQARQRADAVTICLEVPADAPEHAEARALAGELLSRDGRHVEALRVVEEALAGDPDETVLVVARAEIVERAGDVDRARRLLDEAQAKRPEDEELIYARASLEDRAGDGDRAVAIMQTLLDGDPDNVMAMNFIGYSLASRGVELPRAERLLARAVDLRPDDGYVLDSWGWLLYQQGKTDEALAALERADRLAPEEPEILLHLGEVHLRRGDVERAKELFNRALTLDPDDKIRLRLEERVKTAAAPT